MKVQILEQEWEYSNDEMGLERMFAEVEALLDQNDLHLNAMRIGSTEIYEDYKEYIVERIEEIEHIEVVAYTVEEMVQQIILSAEHYMERALPPMQQLPREFYQGPNSDSWDSLAQTVEGIQWIYQTIHSVVQAENNSIDRERFKEIITKLDGIFPELSEVVEAKDPVGIADALTYEILPAIHDLYELIKNTIDGKVVRPHVS